MYCIYIYMYVLSESCGRRCQSSLSYTDGPNCKRQAAILRQNSLSYTDDPNCKRQAAILRQSSPGNSRQRRSHFVTSFLAAVNVLRSDTCCDSPSSINALDMFAPESSISERNFREVGRPSRRLKPVCFPRYAMCTS